MGRKKRKTDPLVDEGPSSDILDIGSPQDLTSTNAVSTSINTINVKVDDEAAASSSYAVTSHSGEIIHEDIYVSDGSKDSDDEDEIEVVLVGSRMGLMRKGLHQLTALQQPNRQWTRQATADKSESENLNPASATVEVTEEEKRQQEEKELSKLDPAQRAARLLLERRRRRADRSRPLACRRRA